MQKRLEVYGNFVDEPNNNIPDSESFRFRSKITNNTNAEGNINLEMVL